MEAHLEGHIEKLPPEDARSRAILDQMKIDEAKHAKMAEDSGAYDLPRPVKRLMKVTLLCPLPGEAESPKIDGWRPGGATP